MLYIELACEAQLHRETYIAVLNGLLQEPASKRQFAKTVGITPQYLSYLLNPYDRLPGAALARKMVAALPLDADARADLYEHMLLAREKRVKACQVILQDFGRTDVAMHLDIIQRAQQAAVFSRDPHQANVQQQVMRNSGVLLLSQLMPSVYPLEFAQLALWLSEMEGILNRQMNALYYAKQAHSVLSHIERTDFKLEAREHFDQLVVNTLRTEGVAYHNLKLDGTAYARYCAAEQTPAAARQAGAWLPHLYRDKINAYSGGARFSIRSVEAWVQHGKTLCEQSVHPQAALWSFMLDHSLAKAYLRYGNLKKGERLLTNLNEALPRLPVVGPLHRVLFLKIYAEAFWQTGDQAGWQAMLGSALTLATDAGLTHQIGEISRQSNKLR